MTLNLTKQTEGCWGSGGRERGVGLWTLGWVCAIVSTVKCVNLAIHRPVALGIKIQYMLIKNKKVSAGKYYLNKCTKIIMNLECIQ